MHPSGLRVQAALDEAGVATRIVETIDPAPTAASAAAQLGIEIGQVANSLVFVVDERPILVMASGGHRVDIDRLAAHFGANSATRANADFVRRHTGQPIGGVAPVGHPSALTTIVDRALATWPEIWAAGGHPHYVFATTFDDLVRMTRGTPLDVGVA